MGAAKVSSDVLTLEILMESGPDKLGSLSFSLPTIRIGRGPENDVVLAADPKVSRLHAEIQQHGSDFYLVNLSTKNFIILNGHRIEKEKLSQGDTLQIGDSTFKVRFPSSKPIEIDNSNFEPQTQPDRVSSPVDFTELKNQRKERGAPANVRPPPGPFSPAISQPGLPPAMPQPSFQAPPFQPPPFQAAPAPPRQKPASMQGDSGKMRFYLIVGVIGILLYFFLSDSGSGKKKDPNAVRTRTDLTQQLEQSDVAITQLKSLAEKQNSVTYRRAQENLVRSLRDFNQGQYSRAMEGFQVVLNLDPNNEMALRYRNLSVTRLDQQVSEMMLQGARYLEKGNYRLCTDAYSKAMILLQGRRDDPKYIQSKKFQEQCRLAQEGRY